MKNLVRFKQIPKIWASVLYLVLLLGAIFLYLSKYFKISAFTALYADFYSHISNFSISLTLGLVVSYICILLGAKFKWLSLFFVLLAFANVLCETVVNFMNTPDVMDMFFGFAGTAIAYGAFFLLSQYGIHPNERKK
ncbi:MAG TPA: hypothetical protein DEP42_05475 [Ruminococcaceae bacterium]|nr:hypothetical protein [Oscillospiraceae bacterium]